jgi:hypothetical protein
MSPSLSRCARLLPLRSIQASSRASFSSSRVLSEDGKSSTPPETKPFARKPWGDPALSTQKPLSSDGWNSPASMLQQLMRDNVSNNSSSRASSSATAQEAGKASHDYGLSSILARAETRRPGAEAGSKKASDAMSSLKKGELDMMLRKRLSRRWEQGDIYAPHDLGAAESRKWAKHQTNMKVDVFDLLGKDPRSFYKVRGECWSRPPK